MAGRDGMIAELWPREANGQTRGSCLDGRLSQADEGVGRGQVRPTRRLTENGLKAEIGIIGGSGLYSMPGFEAQEEVVIETPFGAPSDNYVVGTLAGRQVAFLARHGRGHRISPSELNFRANIYGMKSLGVERIISLSAVGSLKEEHRPLDFVIPDQFFDRTRGRVSTFFGEGLVAHISFADPICPQLAASGGRGLRGRRRQRQARAARTSAWKARRSPPRPNRTSTEAGAWT